MSPVRLLPVARGASAALALLVVLSGLACGGGGGGGGEPATPPARPTGLTASEVTTTSVRLCWSAATGATGYTVLQAGAPAATTAETCAAVTGLAPGTAYSFTVVATAGVLASTPSAAVAVTTRIPAPTGVQVSNLSSTAARVCWTASDLATSYDVQSGGTPLATTGETCADLSLSPSLEYTFGVVARTAIASSLPSDPVEVTTPAGEAACPVPALPAPSALAANPRLPDPFRMADGGRLTLADQWRCRRSQLSTLVEGYELGERPTDDAELVVTGAYVDADAVENVPDGKLTVTVTRGAASISFDAIITYPGTGAGPFPAVIGIGTSSLDDAALRALGAAVIDFPNGDIAEQIDGSSRGNGKFYELYGEDHPAGAMTAWAWGVSRLIDALGTTAAASIDVAHLGVTGCSRNGKGALVAGALEPRLALTIPQESGAGGAASWRVSESMSGVQKLANAAGENVWFRSSFGRFSGAAVNKLPFDQHEVAGLVAPRGLLVIENSDMIWLGNLSTYVNALATQRIWEGLGAKDAMGFSQRGHADHCGFPAAQQPEVTAFVQRFLLDQEVDTQVFKTDKTYSFEEATWIDWTVPALE